MATQPARRQVDTHGHTYVLLAAPAPAGGGTWVARVTEHRFRSGAPGFRRSAVGPWGMASGPQRLVGGRGAPAPDAAAALDDLERTVREAVAAAVRLDPDQSTRFAHGRSG